MVASYRTEEADGSPCLRALGTEWQPSNQHRVLEVERLSSDEVRALVADDALLSDEVRERIVHESGGNPFFAEELAWHSRLGGVSSPGDLGDLIAARSAQLSDDARALLETIAVAARPLSAALAVEASGAGPDRRRSLLPAAAHRAPDRHPRLAGGADGRDLSRSRARHRGAAAPRRASPSPPPAARARARAVGGQRSADGHGALCRGRGLRARGASRGGGGDAIGDSVGVRARGRTVSARDRISRAGGRASGAAREARAGALAGRAVWRRRRRVSRLLACGKLERERAQSFQRSAADHFLRAGRIDEGLALLREVLQAVGIRYSETPRAAIFSLLKNRVQIALSGMRYRLREAGEIRAEDLQRMDACWAATVGHSLVDPLRSGEYQTLNTVLALRLGEPTRLSRALGTEATYISTIGGHRRWRRAGQLVEQAFALAQKLDDPNCWGYAHSRRRVLPLFLPGVWRSAFENCDRATRIFRETVPRRDLGDRHERRFCSTRRSPIKERFSELEERAPALLRARSTKKWDVFGSTTLRVGPHNLVWLARDRPERAEQEAAEKASRNGRATDITLQHYMHLVGVQDASLYRGAAWDAWKRNARALAEVEARILFYASIRARGDALLARCCAARWRRRRRPAAIRRGRASGCWRGREPRRTPLSREPFAGAPRPTRWRGACRQWPFRRGPRARGGSELAAAPGLRAICRRPHARLRRCRAPPVERANRHRHRRLRRRPASIGRRLSTSILPPIDSDHRVRLTTPSLR